MIDASIEITPTSASVKAEAFLSLMLVLMDDGKSQLIDDQNILDRVDELSEMPLLYSPLAIKRHMKKYFVFGVIVGIIVSFIFVYMIYQPNILAYIKELFQDRPHNRIFP